MLSGHGGTVSAVRWTVGRAGALYGLRDGEPVCDMRTSKSRAQRLHPAFRIGAFRL